MTWKIQPWYWFSCVCALLIFSFIWSRRKFYLLSWKLHGPLAFPLLGNIQLALDPSRAINYFDEILAGSPNKLARIWLGTDLYVIVGDATVAAQVNKVIEKPDLYKYLGGLHLKDGLMMATSEERWRRARKLCRPVFGLENLKSFVPIFHAQSLKTVDAFQKLARSGESCLPTDLSRRYSLMAAVKNLFAVRDFSEKEYVLMENTVESIFQHFHNRFVMPLYKNMFVYWIVGLRQKENESMKVANKLVKIAIEDSTTRLENKTPSSDLESKNTSECMTHQTGVNSLMRGIARSGADVTYEECSTQAITLVGGAVDTTKTQNLVTLLMLALNPDVQNKLYKEITEVLGDDINEVPTYEELLKLDYLDRILKECLRLFPAGPIIAKKMLKEIKVTATDGEYLIPAGSTVVNMIYSIQNDPAYYSDPKLFDPDRWIPDQISHRHPNCYLPFSSGPRNCLGGKYALVQMKIFVTSIVRTFEILPSEKCSRIQDVQIVMAGTMRLGENCQFRLKRRRSSDW